jgi:hypothetical protein
VSRVRDALAAAPGGEELLRARRRAVKLASRLRRARPPFGPPEQVAALSAAPPLDDYITGNGFARRCGHVLNFDVLRENPEGEPDWWFCKADYLEHFFARHAPRTPYVLFSHNSDREIGRRFLKRLERPELVAWFAQNAAIEHPKLRAIPIGIANPRWPHGDQDVFRAVQAERRAKTELFDVSFGVETCPRERLHCLRQTGLEPAPRVPFPDYLRRLAEAYFCISPRGNGLDCVRTWEALYLGAVPVVTRSVLTDQHPDLPWIVLDDWSDFRSIDFTPELYERAWGGWDRDELRLDRYLERVRAQLASVR